MKTAIIFDFDYTLADSSKGVVACINYALQSMGVPPRSWNECCATIGLSLAAVYESLTGENDPGSVAMFHDLPNDIAGLCNVVQGLIIYVCMLQAWASFVPPGFFSYCKRIPKFCTILL